MSYKMFVSDLDGTLLGDNHKISKENLAAIKELEKKGIKFVVATGRTKYILEDYLAQVGNKMPYIWSNGGAVSNQDDTTLYVEEVEIETARKIIKLVYKYGLDYMIHTLDGLVAQNNAGRMESLHRYNTRVKKEHRIPLKADPALYDHLDQYALLKISISTEAEASEDLIELQKIISEGIEGVNVVFSEETLLDVTAKNASKGAAVLKIAKMYHIKPEEIVVIGDNENDLSMLEIAGLPLTLENGLDSLKEIAAGVTKNCNESGVADGIYRFVL